jgi:serine/threonine-protein kinase
MVEFEPPQVINSRYRIVELLGKGGMAIVYRAYDGSLERDVAIKFLMASQFGGVQVSERFMREARVVARLSHAHIMAIYDVGQEGTQPYLVGNIIAVLVRPTKGICRKLDKIPY